MRRPLGRRIRDLRGDLGLKQADLARTCGISPSYLNLIEHERRAVGGKLLARIAGALGTDAARLRDGAEAGRLADLAEAADRAAPGDDPPPEVARAEEFAARFPGWAALVARQRAEIGALEQSVSALTDRLANDPILADALHDMLSTVTSIRSASAILVGPDPVAPDWQARFHRNIFEDSQRLADASQGLTRHLDAVARPGTSARLPQEEVEAWFAARAFHVAELERHVPADPAPLLAATGLSPAATLLIARWLARYADDARAIPAGRLRDHVAGGPPDPIRLATETGRPLGVAIRRLATLPGIEAGLVICDASGALVWRKPVAGFPLPRFGAACPLWPLYAALGRPGAPVRARVEQPGTPPARSTTVAVAEESWPAGFDGPPVVEAAMLILPERGGADAPARAVGPTCRVCPRPDCPARREPSALAPAEGA